MVRPRRRAPVIVAAAIATAQYLIAGGAASAPPQRTPRQAAPGTELFDDLYQRGQLANASLKTLTARFTETTTSSLLTRPLTAHGTLAVERPSRVVLHYADPESRVVLIDARRLTMSWPGRNITQVTDIGAAQGRIQKYFVNGTADDLRRQFDIQAHEAPANVDRPATYLVTMVPKRKQIRETLTQMDLWLDRSSLLLTSMRMSFANGDTKIMAFDDVVRNAPIDPGTFAIAR